MGKISKLFKGELKKIFLGPGMFFMTAFLILILTIAPKFFSPTSKEDISTSTTLSTTDVSSVYSSFLSYKDDYKTSLDHLKTSVEQLIDDNADFAANLKSMADALHTQRMTFAGLVINGSIDSLLNSYNELVDLTTNLSDLYASYTGDYTVPLVLVEEDLDYEIKFEVAKLYSILNANGDNSTREYYIKIDNDIDNYRSTSSIISLVSRVANLNYSSENLQKLLDTYYDSKPGYKSNLLSQITANANTAITDEEYNISKSKIDETANLSYSYLSVDYCAYKVIESSLYLELSSSLSDGEISKYYGFESFNSYKYEEQSSAYKYLLTNRMSDSQIANVFAFNTNSGTETNAFDYAYFVMEIASFLIIAFTVILGAGMIAKEYSDGTIKLLAIRPFKRNKIIMAKILATMFLAFLLVIVSAIVGLITGSIIYGIYFPSVLVVFNASVTFAIPIWVLFIIYLACLMIKIWVFALIAIAISTIFKSYILAVCISAGIYIFNLIVSFISNGANWLKYNIFANLDLFKYFGGSFKVSPTSGQNITSLFASPVFADTTIWTSVITIAVMAVILNIVLFTVFRHKDIT